MTGTTIRTGNFAAFRGSVVHRLLLHPLFDLSYASTFLALSVPVHEVPCGRGQRYAGHSQMGYPKLVLHGVRMLMPFIDRIAIRALLFFAFMLLASMGIATAVIAVRLFTDAAIPGWATYTLLGTVILSVVSLGNFVTLFTVFSQARGTSLANIEAAGHGGPRVTPNATD
jgi:hypothetical protein